MKRSTLPIALLLPACCQAADLNLELRGRDLTGHTLMIRLFAADTPFDSDSDCIREIRTVAASERATLQIKDLARGRYAIAAFADLNRNEKLDRSFAGRPTEPYGFSNNARSLFDPPSFNDAAFELDRAEITLLIDLQ